jgi:hypothetical protein
VTAYPDLGLLNVAVILLGCFQKIPRIITDLGMASHIVAVVNPGRSGLRECTLLCTDQNSIQNTPIYYLFIFYIFVYTMSVSGHLRNLLAHRYTVST